MVLSDAEIRHLIKTRKMIRPAALNQVNQLMGEKVISYGVTSYGYDARLASEYKVFTNHDPTLIVDPKKFDSRVFIAKKGDSCVIPPNSFILGRTVETFKIPREVLTLCIGKSSYARCGIFVNVTPLEPEWEGTVTMEIYNSTPLPARVYAHEGICQFLFLRASEICSESYKDRSGKYMGQKKITLPRMK